MKKLLLTAITAGALALGTSAYALNASDDGSNYAGGWTDGSNGGTGFGDWEFAMSVPSGSYAGAFIGDPANAGVAGMASDSFGLYANPAGVGANSEVRRSFSEALSVGDTFSFQLGTNWDTDDASSFKGFSLFSGGLAGEQILSISQGNSGTILLNGANMFTEYGANAMDVSITVKDVNTLDLIVSARKGGDPDYVGSIDITGFGADIDSFKFYMNGSTNPGDPNSSNRQLYFDNLEVVPEPSTYALLALSAAGFGGYVIRRRRK